MSDTSTSATRVAIIGAGIAGLSAAHNLIKSSTKEHQIEVSLFESSSTPGGIISTKVEHDCIVEEGPDSFVTFKPAAIKLCTELGLTDQLLSTNQKFRRAFVAWKGKLEPIPEGFMMIAPTKFDKLFQSNLFSRTGKLRMAFEQFIPKGKVRADESVASFVTRRFGKEALERIGQPLLGGIYTADPETLSLASTMPKYLNYEQEFGSVTMGLLHEKLSTASVATTAIVSAEPLDSTDKTSGARYSAFVSFAQGQAVLIDALVNDIQRAGGTIYTDTRIDSINQNQNKTWTVVTNSQKHQIFDKVIIATPSFVAAGLLGGADADLSKLLKTLSYASSAVLNLLFDRNQIKHPLDGFGFVVPAIENRKIIAASFSSVKFSKRCPEDQALIRVFIGGALQEELLNNNDSGLIQVALEELDLYLGIQGQPVRSWVKRWNSSMPQFKLGHKELIASIQDLTARLEGLYLCGAYLDGVGIPDCIASANKACASLIESLK
jgi:oxygen-dependent protoporphyrinogen oxidase